MGLGGRGRRTDNREIVNIMGNRVGLGFKMVERCAWRLEIEAHILTWDNLVVFCAYSLPEGFQFFPEFCHSKNIENGGEAAVAVERRQSGYVILSLGSFVKQVTLREHRSKKRSCTGLISGLISVGSGFTVYK